MSEASSTSIDTVSVGMTADARPTHLNTKAEVIQSQSPILVPTPCLEIPTKPVSHSPARKNQLKNKINSVKQLVVTPKENIPTFNDGHADELGSPRQYNLRSRTNSHAQSPYSSNSSPVGTKNAVIKHLERKSAILSRI